MSYPDRLSSLENSLAAKWQNLSYSSLRDNLKEDFVTKKKKYVDGFYWVNSDFNNNLENKNEEQFENYLHFFSSPYVERNIEMLDMIGEKQDWSSIANSIDHDISPKHISVKAGEMTKRNILEDKKDWTPMTEDMLDVYNHYKKRNNSEKPLKELIDVSKSNSSREIYANYQEQNKIIGDDLKKDLDTAWPTFYQHALPRMDDAEIIDWKSSEYNKGRNNYINQSINPQPSFTTIQDFLGATETVIRHHN